MTCRDFERGWNDLLDSGQKTAAGMTSSGKSDETRDRARSGRGPSALESSLRQHAATCAACGQIAPGYERLAQAIEAWRAPPTAPSRLADRVLEIALPTPSRPSLAAIRRGRRAGLALAAAVAVALVLVRPWIGGRRLIPTTNPPERQSKIEASGHAVDGRALQSALADASAATWKLARSASEPAARISRQMLDAATSTQTGDRGLAPLDEVTGRFVVSAYMPSAPDTDAASAVVRAVGHRLATGVEPLSTTARQAFGFLLGSAANKPQPRATPLNPKGA